MKKLVFISHNLLGREVLSEILKSIKKRTLDIAVVLVITRKPSERFSDQASFTDLCIQYGVPFIETDSIKSDQGLIAKVKEVKPDFIFVFGWSQLIPNEILSSAKLALGSHPTLLPKNRGNAAIPWTILLGEKKSGVTLFELKGDVDSGDIAAQDSFPISSRESSTTLYSKVIETTKKLTLKILPHLVSGKLKLIPQSGTPTYLGRRIPRDSMVDWNQDSVSVDRLIRAASIPYPEAYSYLWKKRELIKVEVVSSEIVDDTKFRGVPGSVVAVRSNGVLVMCGKGNVRISKLRIDGALRDARTFLTPTDRFDASMGENLAEIIMKKGTE